MEIRKSVGLQAFTSLGIGGRAEYFLLAKTMEELVGGVRFALERDLPLALIGGGTNVLIADEGVPGFTIKFQDLGLAVEGTTITAGAGVPMGVLVTRAAAEGLTGLEWAGGLPGTLGGAIFGNAGTHGRATGELLGSVRILRLPDCEQELLSGSALRFDYRDSVFKEAAKGAGTGDAVILGATLALERGERAQIRKKTLESVQFRALHHPHERSCGSIFKNPAVTTETYEQLCQRHPQLRAKRPGQGFETLRAPVGFLIEIAGLKGRRLGGAEISAKHANFIINRGDARAKNVLGLIREARERVAELFGIAIEPEIRFIPSGFGAGR
ncbi:MAG: UDP-N-acetylmuramate dehydrogenase [bacterium]|nr:UDP-N-acetylmuramate dehydrogenase [bacterium]MDZ4296209.1 UDP-N-acetylmuramate dehydrogenase [Patescibacteria group bacterium]